MLQNPHSHSLLQSNFLPNPHNPPQYPILNTSPDSMDPSAVDFRAFYPYTPNEVKHRKRTTSAQLKVLEGIFKHDTKPNAALRNELAVQLDMTARGVQVWFQNRRAKEKTKATKAASSSNQSTTAGSSNDKDSVAAIQRPENVHEISSSSSFPVDLPELSATETSSQESSPAGASPPHLQLVTDASWQSSPIATPDDFRPSDDFTGVCHIRRGSLPVDAFAVPDDCQQGSPLVGHLDPFTRRRSVDASLHRLAHNPYAGLARAKTSAFAGPRISGHLHDLYSSGRGTHHPGAASAVQLPQHGTFHTRHASMDLEARPYRLSPGGGVSSSSSPSPLSGYHHTIRSSLPDNSLFAFSSRPIASPIPGPLPSPDFSFGAPAGYTRSESDRSSPDSSHGYLYRSEDVDTEDDATSYDGLSRFGSIASVSTNSSSAYYSDCVPEHELNSDANLQNRRPSCTSGQFVGLMSGLNVGCENHGNSPSGLYEQNHNDGTGTYPSPSSTISAGNSPPLATGPDSSNVASSSSTDLSYALQRNDQLGMNVHSASPVVDAEGPFYPPTDNGFIPSQPSQYGGNEYPSYVPVNQENIDRTYEHDYSAEANYPDHRTSLGMVAYSQQDSYCVNPNGVPMPNFL
ncbi:hypothetical protein VNI00_004055 [Paramarasmius palmivorus]|uniref:Homeobox domain-containing protein n=1 Tax=Paramarasmius palmivorus TaxID=297713 RepID=A0AAW0DLJ9_9AGAR